MYSILTDGITAFSINPTTGEISTTQSIDYETQQLYEFTVGATDELRRTSTANVTIMVLDVNDNSPIFAYTTTLPFDELDEWSYMVTATDQDSGANGTITYQIIDGDVAKIFTINAESGEIRVTGTFDREMFPSFTLTVQAIDGGTPTARNGQATVMINVGSSSPCGSTATLHSVKLLLYLVLPLLVLLVSATLWM